MRQAPVTRSQSDLDHGLALALANDTFSPGPLQQQINNMIGPDSKLGQRMRRLCRQYNFVIAPITVGARSPEVVRGAVMLHFFTHNERHRLRVEWGGMRSAASAAERSRDPGRWANNCWDLVRRIFQRVLDYSYAAQDVSIGEMTDDFLLMDSVWWSAPHNLGEVSRGTYHPVNPTTNEPVSNAAYTEMLAINSELQQWLFGLFKARLPTLVMSSAATNFLNQHNPHPNMFYQPFSKCWHPCAISPGFGPRRLPTKAVITAHDNSVHAFLVACRLLGPSNPVSAIALAREMWQPDSFEYSDQQQRQQVARKVRAFGSGNETDSQLVTFFGSGSETKAQLDGRKRHEFKPGHTGGALTRFRCGNSSAKQRSVVWFCVHSKLALGVALSITQALRVLGESSTNVSSVSKACVGQQRTCLGYHWEYIESGFSWDLASCGVLAYEPPCLAQTAPFSVLRKTGASSTSRCKSVGPASTSLAIGSKRSKPIEHTADENEMEVSCEPKKEPRIRAFCSPRSLAFCRFQEQWDE